MPPSAPATPAGTSPSPAAVTPGSPRSSPSPTWPGSSPGTRITWLVRRGTAAAVQAAFGSGTTDQLPARGALGLRARAAVDSGAIEVRRGFRTSAVEATEAGALRLTAENGQVLDDVDEVVVLTGFRPHLTWLSQVRLDVGPCCRRPASSPC